MRTISDPALLKTLEHSLRLDTQQICSLAPDPASEVPSVASSLVSAAMETESVLPPPLLTVLYTSAQIVSAGVLPSSVSEQKFTFHTAWADDT